MNLDGRLKPTKLNITLVVSCRVRKKGIPLKTNERILEVFGITTAKRVEFVLHLALSQIIMISNALRKYSSVMREQGDVVEAEYCNNLSVRVRNAMSNSENGKGTIHIEPDARLNYGSDNGAFFMYMNWVDVKRTDEALDWYYSKESEHDGSREDDLMFELWYWFRVVAKNCGDYGKIVVK